MTDILNKIKESIKEGTAENFLNSKKPFAAGMYRFSMFVISYYARVRQQLDLDYDSFIIVQTVVGHTLYHLNKNKNSPTSYQELQTEWNKHIHSTAKVVEIFDNFPGSLGEKNADRNNKLTCSSICLVTNLPKETVRRKVKQLIKKNLLKTSNKNGITLGAQYKKIFSEFVPQTLADVTKLVKDWEKNGVLKSILNFKILK